MSSIQFDPTQAPRAPYIQFETRAVEDREASLKDGCYRTKDVPFVIVTPQGSKDRIERHAEEWLAVQVQSAAEGRIPDEWPAMFRRKFEAWKSGQEMPTDGTSVRMWPALSPSQVDTLLRANIRTIEDLAVANEESLARIGMGARQLKERAIDYLKSFDSVKHSNELTTLRTENEGLRMRVETLASQVERLLAAIPQQSLPNPVVVEAKPEAIRL